MTDDFHYPHEPAKFITGTYMLSAEEKGAYIVLINLIYLRGGAIDNDPNRLPGVIGCTRQAFRRILTRLVDLGKIVLTQDGGLSNGKCERVMAKRAGESQQRRESGQKGGQKSAGTRKKLAENLAKFESDSAKNNDLASLPLEHKENIKEYKHTPSVCVSPPRDAKGTRLPDDWRPTADGMQFASDLGLNAEYTLGKFTDHWRAKPGKDGRKSDWNATWRNWCRNDAEKLRKPMANAGLPLLTAIQGGKSAVQDPNDAWGIQGWCNSDPRITPLPDTAREDAKRLGKWHYASKAGGKVIDFWAGRIAEAAGWKREWRGDWPLILEWADLGITLLDVCAVVKRVSESFRNNRDPAATLKAFDKAIRERRAAA